MSKWEEGVSNYTKLKSSTGKKKKVRKASWLKKKIGTRPLLRMTHKKKEQPLLKKKNKRHGKQRHRHHNIVVIQAISKMNQKKLGKRSLESNQPKAKKTLPNFGTFSEILVAQLPKLPDPENIRCRPGNPN